MSVSIKERSIDPGGEKEELIQFRERMPVHAALMGASTFSQNVSSVANVPLLWQIDIERYQAALIPVGSLTGVCTINIRTVYTIPAVELRLAFTPRRDGEHQRRPDVRPAVPVSRC